MGSIGNKQRGIALLGVLFLLAACGGAAFALDPKKLTTQYIQRIWHAVDGLPNDSVKSIIQTRNGYLWLGTDEGLVRFDGARFTIFDKRNTKGLKSNNILTLYEAKDESLWIGTVGGGLTQYKNGQFFNYGTEKGLSQDHITSIYEGSGGTLWIGTDSGGLNQFKNGEFRLYPLKGKPNENRISQTYEDRSGNLWLCTMGGLIKVRDGKSITFTTQDGLPSNFVSSIYEGPDGRLWVGTDRGLVQFGEGGLTTYTIKDGLPNDRINSLLQGREGSLWIGTYGNGIARFDGHSFSTYEITQGLSSNNVLAMVEDREGILWIGTEGGGLVALRDGNFTSYGTKEGLSRDLVYSVTESRDGTLWIGTDGGGLNSLRDGKFSSYGTSDGLSGNSVTALLESRDGSMWVGMKDGALNRYHDGKFTIYRSRDNLSGNTVRAILEDHDGNLWIGTMRGGLKRIKDGRLTPYSVTNLLPGDFVRAIYEVRDRSLWIGTESGLSHLKDGKVTTYTTAQGLSNNSVSQIYEDNDKTLWIGTVGGGLNRFKDGTFTSYTSQQGLFDDVIWQILEDDHENLWMSSNKGVFRVSKKELGDYDSGRVRSFNSISYDTTDGMRSRECNGGGPAGWKTRDGRLWFPTTKGVVVVNPNDLAINQAAPPVVIEQAFINEKQVNPNREIQIPPGDGQLEFHYTALSFLVPEKVRFKYRLEGFDKTWVDAGTKRSAHYTNLSPGSYRFRVIACNNDGVWNETGATFEFYLQPHFYRTGWFYALCALAATIAGFGLYRFRVRQLRRRTEELEMIVERRTGELKSSQEKVLMLEKDATEQQMAGGFAHEMRNALAGSKLILNQALALDGPEPHISLNLANCRSLKEIYLAYKNKLPENDTQVVLGQMQTIFANEERVEQVMQLVLTATIRGLNITQQIMDYSKLGQQQPGQQTVDLRNLILNIVNESREEYASQGVAVEHKQTELPISIMGDETHFYSILKNIIQNARDALIDPSLKARRDRRIEITTTLALGSCSVVIADNGIGIPAESLQKVFEPFFSTKPATGTGLGLGMVKKMVSLYNGSIDVSSEVGKGTSVRISLPISWKAETL